MYAGRLLKSGLWLLERLGTTKKINDPTMG
jgi:hypothetical protein